MCLWEFAVSFLLACDFEVTMCTCYGDIGIGVFFGRFQLWVRFIVVFFDYVAVLVNSRWVATDDVSRVAVIG